MIASSLISVFLRVRVDGQAHPLGALLGSPQLEKKVAELREELAKAARFDNWTVEMDEALVLLVQTYCGKLGVSPTTLDAIMLS